MAGNTAGTLFRLTTFGESHGSALGGVIDGCPSGLSVDLEKVQGELDRRRPGQSKLTTQRKEEDKVEFLSGIFEGKTLGSPIGFVIKNKDHKSEDYSHVKDGYRPNHGDYTWEKKFGNRDYRGGGRASARETVCRVVAGAIAKQILDLLGVELYSYVSLVGQIEIPKSVKINPIYIENNVLRCPHEKTANEMIKAIETVQKEGDSLGGIISGVVKNVPVGWGEPVFDKLHANLGKALFSINAVKGVSFGEGFSAAKMKGSEMNDLFVKEGDSISTKSNNSGGIQAGISNGNDILFEVAFKPVASILKNQDTINPKGEKINLVGKGRHDPCVVPRAVPIVDAMVAIVLVDAYLLSRTNRI